MVVQMPISIYITTEHILLNECPEVCGNFLRLLGNSEIDNSPTISTRARYPVSI